MSVPDKIAAEAVRNGHGRPRKILCLDFDGVLHSYTSGWSGAASIPDNPVPGAMKFLEAAVEEFRVQVFSGRSHQPGGIEAMHAWLLMHLTLEVERPRYVLDRISFPTVKPPAHMSIDDRGMRFEGEWPSLDEIKAFKPWNKRSATPPPHTPASRRSLVPVRAG